MCDFFVDLFCGNKSSSQKKNINGNTKYTKNIDKAIKEDKITTVWKVTYTAELR